MDEAGGSIRWIFPRCEIKLGTHKTTSSKNSNGPTSQDCDKMSTFSLPKEGLGLNEQYEQQAWQNPSPPCFGSIRFWTLATPMRIPCKTRWFARSLQLSSASRPSIACEPSGNGTRKWGNSRGKLQRNGGRFCTSFPIGSMYGIYANIGGILMVNVTIYSSTMDPMGFTISNLGLLSVQRALEKTCYGHWHLKMDTCAQMRPLQKLLDMYLQRMCRWTYDEVPHKTCSKFIIPRSYAPFIKYDSNRISPIYRWCSNVFSLNPPFTDFPWPHERFPESTVDSPPFPARFGWDRAAGPAGLFNSRHVCWWCMMYDVCPCQDCFIMFHLLYLLCTSVWFSIPKGFLGSFQPIKQQPGAARGAAPWGHHRLQRRLGSFHGLHGWDEPRSADMGEWMGSFKGYMDWRKFAK